MMNEIERINDQSDSCYMLPEFEVDPDDNYEGRCAEIFITLNRVLAFHCSLCNKKYGSFDHLLKHLSVEHYGNIHEYIYETKLEDSFQPDLDEDQEETNDEESTGPLDETLHEYNELQYTGKFKIDKKYNIEISDEEYYNIQDGEKVLEEIENVIIMHNSHSTSEEPQSTDQRVKVKETSERVTSNLSEEHDRKTLVHINASQENVKPKKVRKKGQFKCDMCNKIFTQRYYLKIHLITHSSERKHKCEFCGFAFKIACNLKSHIRRCHIGQKNISCDNCSKMFYTKSEFEAHVRTQHTGEKPYICSFCGLAFQTASRMTAHSKRHTEKAPYECSFCKKAVWGKGELKDHLLVHTKEKPFACPICSARFPRRKSMLRHTKLHEK